MTTPPRPVEIHRLFPTLAYTAVLDELSGDRDALVADVVTAVEGAPDGSVRTPTPLQDQSGAHWGRYFSVIGSIVDEVAATLHPAWTAKSHNSWGLVFKDPSDWPDNFTSIHAHAQATFSTVCYLNVPQEFDGQEYGGTLVRNPLANIHHRYYDVDYVRFDPVTLGFVIIPGFMEHLPEKPPPRVSWSEPRVIVATDFCYY